MTLSSSSEIELVNSISLEEILKALKRRWKLALLIFTLMFSANVIYTSHTYICIYVSCTYTYMYAHTRIRVHYKHTRHNACTWSMRTLSEMPNAEASHRFSKGRTLACFACFATQQKYRDSIFRSCALCVEC